MAPPGGGNLLPVFILVALALDSLHTKCCRDNLNLRLSYNYFRFKKINVRHFGFLHPVSILTISPLSACNSASACQISSKLDHPRRSYDVISISRWQPWQRKSTSCFHFSGLVVFRWPISTRIPNFVEISQSQVMS